MSGTQKIPSPEQTTDHWAVTVYRNGEEVVTLSTNSLSGRDLDPRDEEAIRTAGHHLLAFIGERE